MPIEHPVGNRQQLHAGDRPSRLHHLPAVGLPAGLHLDLPDNYVTLVLDDVNGAHERPGTTKC